MKDPKRKNSVDFRLLENIPFDLLCLGYIIGFTGYNAEFLYLPAIVYDMGSTKQEGAWLISILSKDPLYSVFISPYSSNQG